MNHSSVITSADVSCLIVPDGCIGIPTLAALAQGITVVAVRENTNLMRNDLSRLPGDNNQLIYVDTYLEAAGVLAALKYGVAVDTVRRPFVNADILRNEAKIAAPKQNISVTTSKTA